MKLQCKNWKIRNLYLIVCFFSNLPSLKAETIKLNFIYFPLGSLECFPSLAVWFPAFFPAATNTLFLCRIHTFDRYHASDFLSNLPKCVLSEEPQKCSISHGNPPLWSLRFCASLLLVWLQISWALRCWEMMAQSGWIASPWKLDTRPSYLRGRKDKDTLFS